MVIISIVCAVVTGNVDATLNAVFEGAQSATATMFSFAGAMCFWTGIMKIAEKSGFSETLCRIISPLIARLFPGSSAKAREYISMNITANILGMGNAATPMGILAAKELDRENHLPDKPSKNMCMLLVLNTTSFQLVPSTIISLRAAAGSSNAASVILPIWLVSAFSVLVGTLSVKLLIKREIYTFSHSRPPQ